MVVGGIVFESTNKAKTKNKKENKQTKKKNRTAQKMDSLKFTSPPNLKNLNQPFPELITRTQILQEALKGGFQTQINLRNAIHWTPHLETQKAA